jgi:predicted nuclease of restriction endonuclease-like (RecB) superfamily
VQKKAEERWGAGVVEQVSLDLKREFPDADGFSTSNLWYMKKWYLFYTDGDSEGKSIAICVGTLGHHVDIITKCKSIDEALFYVGKTIEQGLSRNSLANFIKANLYEHQGKIVNNFTDHLPALQSKLVQEVLKENYDFGFATVEHEIYDEAELEEALTKNVTDLLLELGTGFAFLGRQKELVVGGRLRKIDLLFYHIRLRCYIVCELKAKPFEHYPYFGSYGSLFGLLPYLQIGRSMSTPKKGEGR